MSLFWSFRRWRLSRGVISTIFGASSVAGAVAVAAYACRCQSSDQYFKFSVGLYVLNQQLWHRLSSSYELVYTARQLCGITLSVGPFCCIQTVIINCLKQHLAIPILNIWKTCLYTRTWFLSVYNFQCADIVWKQMAPFKRSRMGALIGRFHTIGEQCTVYPKKYAHGFVVLCFVVVMQSFIMNSHEVFIHIHQGCFAGTGAIVRLPQCQWSKPDGYGKISQCITTTKHSKAKTVYIFFGIYCI